MAIDNCNHSFEHLVGKVLPSHLENLKRKIASAYDMTLFAEKGVGKRTILKKINQKLDFSGCYVLLEDGKPVYVGISRSVIQRLSQHVKGNTHFDASLAYRIATERTPHNNHRHVAMSDPEFKAEFDKAKQYLKSLKVAFIEIQNDLEIYLFEPYCAMKLDTDKWNTFRTH